MLVIVTQNGMIRVTVAPRIKTRQKCRLLVCPLVQFALLISEKRKNCRSIIMIKRKTPDVQTCSSYCLRSTHHHHCIVSSGETWSVESRAQIEGQGWKGQRWQGWQGRQGQGSLDSLEVFVFFVSENGIPPNEIGKFNEIHAIIITKH